MNGTQIGSCTFFMRCEFQKGIPANNNRIVYGNRLVINGGRKIGAANTDHSWLLKQYLRSGKMHFNHRRIEFFSKQGIGKLRRKTVHCAAWVNSQVLRTESTHILNGVKYSCSDNAQ